MPVYEYICKECSKLIEIMHSMSDDSKKFHEKCGGELRKIVSASEIFYRGEGWARKG